MKFADTVHGGERSNPSGKAISNKILLSISDAEFALVRPHLEFQELPQGRILHEAGMKLQFAYFPNRGLISLVVASKAARGVEAGVVGFEGFVGTPLAVGLFKSPLRQIVQIAGDGCRIRARGLTSVLPGTPDFQMRLSRYAVLQGMQVAETAACNRLHEIQQRLARWLLMAQDRVGAGALPITHEFLAVMLGTDRPSVTLAAGALQRKKAIEYTRGNVQVLNRKKLEGSACTCYRAIQELNGDLGLR